MAEKLSKEKQEEQVAEKLSEFLKQHNAELLPSLTFPVYNKLPVELELAVAIIKRHEPQFDIQVTIKQSEKPE